jgi:glycosyltransferase involved in cell wall biosynthesis
VSARRPRVACFATQGTGTLDEERVRTLLEPLEPSVLPFDRANKLTAALRLVLRIRREQPDLVVMEGTGIAGGAALIACRILLGCRYVVSSGDAVGPYVRLVSRGLAPIAALYERILYRLSAGFIGWSPYLAGRALTFGTPRAMVAAGWAPDRSSTGSRSETRTALGIPEDAIVFGLVGSLAWSDRSGYCYGLELVQALRETSRSDLRVVIVGDGDGRSRLERMASGELGARMILTGAVPRDEVGAYLEAFDVASLPQSVDGVGAFRYTTKLADYLAAGLPIVTGQIPLAYDLDDGWLWRLAGDAPWDSTYISALADLMGTLTAEDLARRRSAVPRDLNLFSKPDQQHRAAAFISDLVARPRSATKNP